MTIDTASRWPPETPIPVALITDVANAVKELNGVPSKEIYKRLKSSPGMSEEIFNSIVDRLNAADLIFVSDRPGNRITWKGGR